MMAAVMLDDSVTSARLLTSRRRRPVGTTSGCSPKSHVLEIGVGRADPAIRRLVEFQLSGFPLPAHGGAGWRRGGGGAGSDVWLAFVVCVLLGCALGVHTTRLSTSVRNHPSPTTCPRRCSCLVGSRRFSPTVNVTCSGSALTEVPQPIGAAVRSLDLSRNLISELGDGSLAGARFLRRLNLAHNRLKELRARALGGLTKLIELDLRHNLLSTVHSDAFASSPLLARLDLSHNLLTELASGLFSIAGDCGATRRRFPRLRYLDLSDNPELGSHLDSSEFCFERLRYLGLRNTGLMNLQVVVDALQKNGMEYVECLNVSWNEIVSLGADQLDILLDRVDRLDLSDNPFRCDCSALVVVVWLAGRGQSVLDRWLLPTCRRPDGLRDVPVPSLSSAQVSVGCDAATRCRLRDQRIGRPDSGSEAAGCRPPAAAAQLVTDLKIFTVARTTTRPLIPYDSIRTEYDPMLGWYTAMALMSMVLGLILCILFDRVKKKYQNYRYRMWRRKVYEAMDVSGGELPDLVGSQMDPEGGGAASNPSSTADITANANDVIGSGSDKPDVCNNVRHATPRQVSLSRRSLVRQASSTDSAGIRWPGHGQQQDSSTSVARLDSSAPCRRVGHQRTATSSKAVLERSQSLAVDGGRRIHGVSGTSRPELSRSSSAASDSHPETGAARRPAGHRHHQHHHHHQNHHHNHHQNAHHRHHASGATHQQTGRRANFRRSQSTTAEPRRDKPTPSGKPPMARSASTASSGCRTCRKPGPDSMDRPTSGADRSAAADVAVTKPSTRTGPTASSDRRSANHARLGSGSPPPKSTGRPTALGLTVNAHTPPAPVHSPTNNNTAAPRNNSAWQTLTQVIRELKVAEVNPDCPLHNRRNYQKLRSLLQNNPDLTLEALLEELKTKC